MWRFFFPEVFGFGIRVKIPKRSIHVSRSKQGGGDGAIKSFTKRGRLRRTMNSQNLKSHNKMGSARKTNKTNDQGSNTQTTY